MDNTLIASDSTNIYPRPFLVPFLKFCFENFRTVSIWTAAEESWFNIVNKFVFQPILTQLSQQLHKQCKFYFVLTRPSVKFVYTSHTSKLGQQNVGQQSVVMIKDLNDIWRKPLTYPGFTMGNTVIIDDIPETRGIRKCRHAFKHQAGRGIRQRAIQNITMAGNPANIGSAPVNIVVA